MANFNLESWPGKGALENIRVRWSRGQRLSLYGIVDSKVTADANKDIVTVVNNLLSCHWTGAGSPKGEILGNSKY